MKNLKKEEAIKGFKAFSKNLTCKDYQFEIGKTYTHDGNIIICEQGFHFCKNPFDVLNYYDLIDSRFCEVIGYGQIDEKTDDTKICCSIIEIVREVNLNELISFANDYLYNSVKNVKDSFSKENSAKIGSSGGYAQIGSSGYYAQIGSSGDYAKIGSSGDSAQIEIYGKNTVCANIGYNGKIKGVKGTWVTLG